MVGKKNIGESSLKMTNLFSHFQVSLAIIQPDGFETQFFFHHQLLRPFFLFRISWQGHARAISWSGAIYHRKTVGSSKARCGVREGFTDPTVASTRKSGHRIIEPSMVKHGISWFLFEFFHDVQSKKHKKRVSLISELLSSVPLCNLA